MSVNVNVIPLSSVAIISYICTVHSKQYTVTPLLFRTDYCDLYLDSIFVIYFEITIVLFFALLLIYM